MRIKTYFVDICEYEPVSGGLILVRYFNYEGCPTQVSRSFIRESINWRALSLQVI